MSMTDPIADMLTRVRNANSAYKASTTMPSMTFLATQPRGLLRISRRR